MDMAMVPVPQMMTFKTRHVQAQVVRNSRTVVTSSHTRKSSSLIVMHFLYDVFKQTSSFYVVSLADDIFGNYFIIIKFYTNQL